MNTEEKCDRDCVISVLQRLPENASMEDIRYEAETILGVLEGLRDDDEGHTFSHEEVMEDVRKWLPNFAGQPAPVAK